MTTARWIEELVRQARRGRHVLLYGNVQDQMLYRGTYLGLRGTLDAVLGAEGYDLLAFYDPVDGVTFPRAGMRERFEAMLRLPEGGGVAYRPPGGGAQPSGRPSDEPFLVAQDVALPALRTALRSTERRVAVVLDYTDKLTASQEHQMEEERRALIRIRKMTSEAARVAGGPRNLLVLVAPILGQVPGWLYRENPFVQTVEVEMPQAEERQFFFSQEWPDFHGASAAPSAAVLSELADLTDGLSNWDLESLRLTSHHERIGLDQVRRLVDFFKHGRRDDPWERLDRDRLLAAGDTLRRRVIGQEPAVRSVLDMLVSARVGVRIVGASGRSTRPKGVFFFVGPTGVGKTELARAMAELIFGDDAAFARFDMSEYSQEHAAEKLTGAPPSYVGYEAGGQLTNSMKRRPFTLVLFDEIEKAHAKLMDKLLQVLDDGRLTDGQGDTVSFAHSVVVFTSNLGSTRRTDRGLEPALSPDMDYDAVEAHYRKAVDDHFRLHLGRPEILNRLGENVVVFDMLRPQHVIGILRKFQSQIAASALEKHGVRVTFDGSVDRYVEAWCSREENVLFGGRGIRNILEKDVLHRLNAALFMAGQRVPGSLTVSVVGGEVVVSESPLAAR